MDKKHLTQETLGPLIDTKIQESIGWFSSKLSYEREKVTRYYNGEYPKRSNVGSSSFISTEVYDSVESMKAQLLETFAAGKNIVRFDPQTPDDVNQAQDATVYTDYTVFRQNDGYRIFSDVIHDGLTSRVGVVKVWWEEEEDVVEEEFDDLDEGSATALAQQPEVEEFEAEESEEGSGIFKGKLKRKYDRSQVRIEVVNPEEFSVEPQAKDLHPHVFCCHTTWKTVDELLRMGYDKKKVEDGSSFSEESVISTNPEVLARFEQIDSGITAIDGNRVQDEARRVVIHEC